MKNTKLRYYLRGLGIGVLVTAFILGITGENQESLTDAQIIERATALGMVDGDALVLSDLRADDTTEEDVQSQEEVQADEDVQPEDDVQADAQTDENVQVETDVQEDETSQPDETIDEDLADEEEQPGMDEVQDTEETFVAGDTVTLVIRSGANSYSVSKELEEMGLVADAGEFDDYLCDNGYARIVRVGTYEIERGTAEEEIAKIITGKR